MHYLHIGPEEYRELTKKYGALYIQNPECPTLDTDKVVEAGDNYLVVKPA
jgi:translation initiation factor 2 beta subunit (eIF-2beta)/eIF-5